MNGFQLADFDFNGIKHVITGSDPPHDIRFVRTIVKWPEPGIIWMRQVHGAIVHRIDSRADAGKYIGSGGDAIMIFERKLPISIFTADCVPMMIFSDKGEFVGLIHGSWRTIKLGIIENFMGILLENFDGEIHDIHCVMGPCILGREYEVGWKVASLFPDSINRKPGNKWLLDLPSEAKRRLMKLGIWEPNIKEPSISTYSEDWLPSYRREGKGAGRIRTIIWLD